MTKGTWRNFHSGQTSSKCAPSSRTETHPRRFWQAATPSSSERPEEGIPHQLILPAVSAGPHGSLRNGDELRRSLRTRAFGLQERGERSGLSMAMVTSTRRAPCKGCNGLPASVMKRLDRDARDAPCVRRLLRTSARTARDRGDEGDTGVMRPPEPDASRRRSSERGAAVALAGAGTIGTDTEPRRRTGRPSGFVGESRCFTNEGSWRGSTSPREGRPSAGGNVGRWYGLDDRAKP